MGKTGGGSITGKGRMMNREGIHPTPPEVPSNFSALVALTTVH